MVGLLRRPARRRGHVMVEPVPGASVGSVGDPTKRISITGPCRVGWREGFAADASTSTRSRSDKVMTTRRYPSSDVVMAEAMEESGLSDFGPGDFRDGLDVLLDSLERDGDLEPAADERVIGDFRRRLVNRLEVEAWYAAHPEIEDLAVQGPVDITRPAPHRHHRARQHALTRSPVPLPARLGADQAVPAADPRRGGYRPAATPGWRARSFSHPS